MRRVSKQINDVDRQVGERVRARRKALGVSQEKLAAALGVSFQQVQKYENGINRISASRLQAIANTFKVPVSVFFTEAAKVSTAKGHEEMAAVFEFLTTQDGLVLSRAFTQIKNKKLRRHIRLFVEQVAADHFEA